MAGQKIANAYIVITPKFDNLKKKADEAFESAARQAANSFGNTFNAKATELVAHGEKSFSSAFRQIGAISGVKFTEGFSKTVPKLSKIVSESATNSAANASMAAAGSKAGKAYASAAASSMEAGASNLKKAFRIPLDSTLGKRITEISQAAVNFSYRMAPILEKQFSNIKGTALVKKFSSIFSPVIELASRAGSKIASAISTPLRGISDKIISPLKSTASKLGSALVSGVKSGVSMCASHIKTAFTTTIPNVLSRAGSRITRLIKSIFTGASSAISTATSVGVRFGTSLVEGIRAGLSRGAGIVKSAIAKLIPNGKSYGLTFSKQLLTGWRSGGAIAGITSAIAYTGIFGVLNTISEATSTAISRVDTMANFPKVMTNLGFGTDLAAASIDKLSDALDGLPTALDAMVSNVSGYTAAIGDLEKATDVGIAINNMMLAGGQGTAMANSAMEQFRQILSKGKPDMQDWKSMMMSAPGQMKQLAKAVVGVEDTDALYEYIGGGVKAEDFEANRDVYTQHMNEFLDAIIKLNKEGIDGFASFEQQAKDATQGIDTALQNLKTRVGKAVAKVLDEIGQTTISAKINKFSYWIQNKIGDFFKDIVIGIKRTVNWDALSQVFEKFKEKSERIFPTNTDAAQHYGDVIGNIANRLIALDEKAIPLTELLGNTVLTFIKWLGNTTFSTFEAFIIRLSENTERIDKAFTSIGEAVASVFNVDSAASFGTIVADVFLEILDGVPDVINALGKLKDYFEKKLGDVNIGDALVEAIDDAFDFMFGDDSFLDKLMNAMDATLNFLSDVFIGFTSNVDVNAFKAVCKELGDTLHATFTTVDENGNTVQTVGSTIGGVLASIANSAVKLIDALLPTIEVLGGGFEQALDWIKKNLPGIAQNIGDFISTVITGTDWKAIGDAVFGFFKAFAEGLGYVDDEMDISIPSDKLAELGYGGTYGKSAGEMLTSGFNALPGIIKDLTPVAHDFAETMRDLVTNIDFEAWRETLNTVFEEIHKGFSDGEGDTKSFGETLADIVEDIRIIVDTLAKSGLIKDISRLIRDLLDVSNSPAVMALLGGAGLGIAGLQIGSLFGPEGAAIGGLAGAILGAGLGGVFGESFSEFAKANQVSPEEYKKRIDDLIAKAPQLGLSEKDVYRKTLTDPYYGWMTDGPLGAFLTTLLKIRFAIEDLGEAWTNFWDGAAKAVEDAKNTMVGAFNAVAEAISGIGDAILGLPDWISSNWDNFVNSLPKFDASVNWGVPMMAAGGEARKPTLALIGEGADNEAVLPLRNSTYEEIAKGINENRQMLTDGNNNAELLEGIRALMGSMIIQMDGRTLGKVTAPYNDKALGSRSRLANRGVAIA